MGYIVTVACALCSQRVESQTAPSDRRKRRRVSGSSSKGYRRTTGPVLQAGLRNRERNSSASAAVAGEISVWLPPVWDTYPDDGQLELKVLPVVRCWVAAARPGDVPMTRRMLRAVSEFAMWMHETSGVVDVRLLLPENVEFWSNQVNAHRTKTWRSDKRWLLRRVGPGCVRGWLATGWGTDPQACSYPPVHTGR